MNNLVIILLIILILLVLFLYLFLRKKSLSPVQESYVNSLKTLTPEQISQLPKAKIQEIASQFIVTSHGIPEFPLLESELSKSQYDAFYQAFSGGKVY